MKCIRCNTDNNLKDRTANQGRCKNCNHPFAFEPTSMKGIKISDSFFAKAILDLSANDTLNFTYSQLLYFIDRRSKKISFNFLQQVVIFYIILFFTIMPLVGGLFAIIFINTFGVNFGLSGLFFGSLAFCAYVSYSLIRGSQKSTLAIQTRIKYIIALRILGVITLIAGIYYSIIFNSFFGFLGCAAFGLITIWYSFNQRSKIENLPQSFVIEPAQLGELLTQWQKVNGPINKLLPPISKQSSKSTQANPFDPEITAYSFDRAIICEKAEIAQMLIANNFHFENNCAILSVTGYPADTFNTIKEMLQRNPQLQVYALHDLSPQGLRLVPQLNNSPKWFANSTITIIDVGLNPNQVLNNPQKFIINASTESADAAKRLEAKIRANLTPEHIAWLELGNYVKVESFTPQKLIQILQITINRGQQLEGSESGILFVDNSTDSYIYATESFG